MNWDGPHCPSWTGGVAATSTKVAKHRQGADGVVVQMFCSSLNNHPVCADKRLLRNILFLAQPPLLSRRGNGATPNSFTTSMYALQRRNDSFGDFTVALAPTH